MTLVSDGSAAAPTQPIAAGSGGSGFSGEYLHDQPVEFWPTAAIRSALHSGDIATWKLIAAALKRDPYGRTARQVEESLGGSGPRGVAKALWEVLDRARADLAANERADLDGRTSPTAALMLRMRRLSDRFVKMNSGRSTESD